MIENNVFARGSIIIAIHTGESWAGKSIKHLRIGLKSKQAISRIYFVQL
jgi:hypothetical protein